MKGKEKKGLYWYIFVIVPDVSFGLQPFQQ